MPVDDFNSVFISDLSKFLFWLIYENFQLSLSRFEFFARFSDGDFLIFWRPTDGVGKWGEKHSEQSGKALMISMNLMKERHMPVDHFNSVFISDLSKLLSWVMSENFQLSLSRFEFFARFSTF